MRGRTLDNAFVILDEAQNTTEKSDENVFDKNGKKSQIHDNRRSRSN